MTLPLKGKRNGTDETTLVFKPAKLLDPGKTYTGELNLYKLGEVKERLRIFPLRFQTLKKDFSISTGTLECMPDNSSVYILNGEIAASDFIEQSEVETYLEAKNGRKNSR